MSDFASAHLNELDTFGPAFMEISGALGRYDTTRQDAEQAMRLLGLEAGARVLDAGCGFGRFSEALLALGCEVVGVDISPAAIAEAERRCPGPQYVIADLTQPLELEPFDAIVNVFSSFGYGATVADDAAVLRTWRAALKPGGRLLMELSDLERSRHRLGEPGTEVRRVDDGVEELLRVDPETHVLQIRYAKGEQVLHVDTRLYEADELVAMLTAAGFGEIARYGGFDARPKQPDDRLVLVATA